MCVSRWTWSVWVFCMLHALAWAASCAACSYASIFCSVQIFVATIARASLCVFVWLYVCVCVYICVILAVKIKLSNLYSFDIFSYKQQQLVLQMRKWTIFIKHDCMYSSSQRAHCDHVLHNMCSICNSLYACMYMWTYIVMGFSTHYIYCVTCKSCRAATINWSVRKISYFPSKRQNI